MAARKRGSVKRTPAPPRRAAKTGAPSQPSAAGAAPASQFATPDGGPWGKCFFPRATHERRYWLVKSEPDVFSWDDLMRAPRRTTGWDGVRNFAARNFLRDGMRVGDLVFFYHSNGEPPAVVGIVEVVREAYPDATAFDARHHGYDEKSKSDAPTWFAVDVRAVEPLPRPVTLPMIKASRPLANMALLRVGRLSVSPVTPAEWDAIVAMSRA